MFYSLYICFGPIRTVVFYLGVVVLCFFTVHVFGGYWLVSFLAYGLLVWAVSVNVVRGSSDCSLVFSTFVLGGGECSDRMCIYILRMVLLLGVM